MEIKDEVNKEIKESLNSINKWVSKLRNEFEKEYEPFLEWMEEKGEKHLVTIMSENRVDEGYLDYLKYKSMILECDLGNGGTDVIYGIMEYLTTVSEFLVENKTWS